MSNVTKREKKLIREEAKREARREFEKEFKAKVEKQKQGRASAKTSAGPSRTRSAIAEDKRKTTKERARDYAQALINPWTAPVQRIPSALGSRRCIPMRTVTRFIISDAGSGRAALFIRPGVWGGYAVSATDGGETSLTYKTTADGVATDGWVLDGWYPQDQAAAIIQYGSQVRCVSQGVKISYSASAVSAQGTSVTAAWPPVEPFPFFNSVTPALSSPVSQQQLVDFLGAESRPAIDGVKAVNLPYSEEAFDFRDLKPDFMWTNNESFVGDSLPEPGPTGGSTYAEYGFALGPIDCDEDQFKGAMMGAMIADSFSPTATDAVLMVNRIQTYTNPQGVGSIAVLWEGLPVGVGEFANVEIVTNWEIIAEQRTLIFGSSQTSQSTDSKATEMAFDALRPMVSNGTSHGALASNAGPSIFNAVHETMSSSANMLAKGAVDSVGEAVTSAAADIGPEIGEAILGGLALLL